MTVRDKHEFPGHKLITWVLLFRCLDSPSTNPKCNTGFKHNFQHLFINVYNISFHIHQTQKIKHTYIMYSSKTMYNKKKSVSISTHIWIKHVYTFNVRVLTLESVYPCITYLNTKYYYKYSQVASILIDDLVRFMVNRLMSGSFCFCVAKSPCHDKHSL